MEQIKQLKLSLVCIILLLLKWPNLQIPVLCGFHTLEKAAVRASGVLRRTGKHLFLRDNDNGKPPLLLQMADDSDDLKFM